MVQRRNRSLDWLTGKLFAYSMASVAGNRRKGSNKGLLDGGGVRLRKINNTAVFRARQPRHLPRATVQTGATFWPRITGLHFKKLEKADFSLNEILSLQGEGPSDNDVSTILEIEQRTYENGLQENGYWLDRIKRGYRSRIYDGDLNASIRVNECGEISTAQDECRNKVRASFSSLTMQSALRRILPFPCKKLYTVVVLVPKIYKFPSLHYYAAQKRHSSIEGKGWFCTAAILALAIICWRVARSNTKI